MKVMTIGEIFDKENLKYKVRLNMITWDFIVAIDPYLLELLEEINELDKQQMDTMNVWYKKYKPIMLRRIGWFAPNYALDLLKTEKAYDIVYRKLFSALCD